MKTAQIEPLTELTTDLSQALDSALWSFSLTAEIEDAFDTALLRAAMSSMPKLSEVALFA